MAAVKAALAAIVAAALAAGAYFGAHYFSSGNTRLTNLPSVVSAAIAHLPQAPAHVVVVIEENKEHSDIAGNLRHAPYLNRLAAQGALFTHSYGVAHPSQPNYTAIFAGVTDTNGDGCPPRGIDTNAPNLSTELAAVHRSFIGYAEDLPQAGSRVCWSGNYARKHVPWADFANVPAREIQPFSALPQSYAKLPTVAFVIPNLLNDMHSASIQRGDTWLREKLGPLLSWAQTHDTLVIITWDESSDLRDNHIPTIFLGPMVKPGRYAEPIDHYRVLRTIEDFYKTGHAGKSAGVPPITGIWR